jgi:hypothetical protein
MWAEAAAAAFALAGSREKADGRDTVGFFLRLPALSSGAIANPAPSLTPRG